MKKQNFLYWGLKNQTLKSANSKVKVKGRSKYRSVYYK